MQRRKKSNRKGFLPAILAGLAGANIISQLGNGIFNRKSGLRKKRKGQYMGRTTPVPRGLLGSNRKGMSMPKLASLLKIKRKSGYKPLIGYGQTVTGRRRRGFDNRKGKMSKLILKKALLRTSQKRGRGGKFSRRKGDLDADFLGEFGGDKLDIEPTRTKSTTRLALDTLKKLWGNKKVKDAVTKSGKSYVDSYINRLSKKQADTAAARLIAGKGLPAAMTKDIRNQIYIAKYR